MLKKKTTAIVGGALVLSTVMLGSASAETVTNNAQNQGQRGAMHMPHVGGFKKGLKKGQANSAISHGIVTALTDDGFAMEARTKEGSTTVMVHTTANTIYKKDRTPGTASDVTLGARVLVRGEKDSLGTSQQATDVFVITKSFATHPFPERIKHKKVKPTE